MTVKRGKRIELTEKELRKVEEMRKDGFYWRQIGTEFNCSFGTVRNRYKEWKGGETEFDDYLSMTWLKKLKYFFKEVLS